jgi:hypothetical protein
MLTDETVRQLANGEEGVYHFDMSQISAEFYEPLLRTLQHFAQRKIDSIGFSCDELARCEQRNLTGSAPFPVSVLNSIAMTKMNYTRNVVELMCHVLPRSSRIREVVFSNFNLSKHLQRIVYGLSRSTSLQAVNFNKVHLGTDGLQMLLNALDPNQIHTMSVMYCGLSQACTQLILDFIKRKDPRLVRGGGISVFQVSSAEFPEADRRNIAEALSGMDLILGNAQRMREREIKQEVAELRALERENAELRGELRQLRESIDAVEYNQDVWIVGKGAEEFVRFIREIEGKIEGLERMKADRGAFY